MADLLKTATDATFEATVLKAEGPVLVDFSAAWCGPCKMQTPVLEKFATERSDVTVVKVDVDESPQTAQKYGVQAMPTLALFLNGEKKGSVVGLQNAKRVEAFVDAG